MSSRPSLNEEQDAAFKALQKFIKHPAADTFILSGYAGTGKTFLMQHFAQWLKKNDHNFVMLASTGRAAAVLRGKTGFEAKTVHGELYRFSNVDGDEDEILDDAPIDKFGQMRLKFLLRPPDNEKLIYIVDEASMLSSELNENNIFASFGSGMLVHDFFDAAGNNKIVFVGDPCQLPPVGQSFSPVLDMDWLVSNNRTAVNVMLKTIERTNADNDILRLAYEVRNFTLLKATERFPKLPARFLNNVTLHESQVKLFREYVQQYNSNNIGETLAIARSNRLVQQINRAMRRELFGTLDLPIQIGDVLLMCQNNYKVPLTNGDFITVMSLGEIQAHVNLHFQSVRVKAALSGQEFEVLLALDILYGQQTNFSEQQSKALMVDFSKRMRRKNIRPNSDEYKKAMMEDDYINSLKATYGYAVTCHKSQGGEWKKVFLFLEKGMYGMKPLELYRWWYTSITRAKEELHIVDGWWIMGYNNYSS